ncbi:hypothetical protein BpHYR1_000912, partial [Brachionus plicatilis]
IMIKSGKKSIVKSNPTLIATSLIFDSSLSKFLTIAIIILSRLRSVFKDKKIRIPCNIKSTVKRQDLELLKELCFGECVLKRSLIEVSVLNESWKDLNVLEESCVEISGLGESWKDLNVLKESCVEISGLGESWKDLNVLEESCVEISGLGESCIKLSVVTVSLLVICVVMEYCIEMCVFEVTGNDMSFVDDSRTKFW